MGLFTILGSGLFFFIILAIFLLIILFASHMKLKIENTEKENDKTKKIIHSLASVIKELNNDVNLLKNKVSDNGSVSLEKKTQNDIQNLFSKTNELQFEIDAIKYNNNYDEQEGENNETENNKLKKVSIANNFLFNDIYGQPSENNIGSLFSAIFSGKINDDNDDNDDTTTNVETVEDYEIDMIDDEFSENDINEPLNIIKLDEENDNENQHKNEEDINVEIDNEIEQDDEDINTKENDFEEHILDELNNCLNTPLNLEENIADVDGHESKTEPEFYPQEHIEVDNNLSQNIDNEETQQHKQQKLTNVNKLSLPELRCLVVEHGLVENAMHLKKNQILKLIEQHNKSLENSTK